MRKLRPIRRRGVLTKTSLFRVKNNQYYEEVIIMMAVVVAIIIGCAIGAIII